MMPCKLNTSLQQRSDTVFEVDEKIVAMIRKIRFWEECLDRGQFEMLNTLAASKTKMKKEFTNLMQSHLAKQKTSLRKYFPKPDSIFLWISNPFEGSY